MRRRDAVKHATLLIFGMVLGQFDALKAAEPAKTKAKPRGGALTVDLGQWKEIAFTLNGTTVAVSVSEIFKSLQESRT